MNESNKLSVLLRNKISLTGFFLGACALITGTVLMIIDASRENLSPYFGILIYLVVPGFHRRLRSAGGPGHALDPAPHAAPGLRPPPAGDRPRRPPDPGRASRSSACWGRVFVVVSAVATYRTYHFTESVQFCGRICHEVMKPEYTAFQQSPHAGTSCVECHIGPGAEWFVKAKISGLYQVYAVLFDKYHRPIETPVENLRPAKETCLACHWPTKFFGAVLRTWTYYGTDEKNSPWTIKMLLNIGGGDPAHGPIRGIHWHMEGVNTVEYIATDRKRLVIPWVRVTDQTAR